MSRIPLLPMKKAGLFTRLIDWALRRQSPDPSLPSAAGIYGYNPPVLLSFVLYGAGYLRWRSLPARLKRLVHLRTAMRVGCPS
jgi:hypothetical protein